MDRTQFLSSIPYLVPTPFLGWPPRRGGSISREKEEVSYRHEVLVSRDSYALSLEPHSLTSRNSKGRTYDSMGPIFFPPSADDASMCPVAMCLEYTSISTTAPAGLFPTVATPTSRRTFRTAVAATSSSPPNCTRECCTAIFIRVQGKSYMLDWTQLKHVAVEVGDDVEEDTNTNHKNSNNPRGKTQTDTLPKNLAGFYMDEEGPTSSSKGHVKKPPSLVFVFESLILRIFPFSASLSSTYDQDRQTDLVELEKIERSLADSLFQMRQEASFGSHWNLLAASSSPAASSTTTGASSLTGSSGQQQAQRHGYPPESAEKAQGTKHESYGPFHGLDRRYDSLRKCQSTFRALHQFLDAPIASLSSLQQTNKASTNNSNSETDDYDNGTSKKHGVEKIIASLVIQSAETLAASYVDNARLEKELVQEQLNQEDSLQVSLEPLLEEFFPSRRKRQRTMSPQKAGENLPDASKTLHQVQVLLDNHQAQAEKRHQLLLLPTRVPS